MTKILVLSDLHTEFVAQCWALPEKLPDFDVCVLAGDIAGSPEKGVDFAATAPALIGKPIIYLPGNHEFFGGEIENRLRVGKEACAGTNVRLLDRDVAIIGGVRFVGAILWTDYALYREQRWSMAIAARGLNDHVRIERRGPQGALRFTPADALARHGADRDHIETILSVPLRRPHRRRHSSRAASRLGRRAVREQRPHAGLRQRPVGGHRPARAGDVDRMAIPTTASTIASAGPGSSATREDMDR